MSNWINCMKLSTLDALYNITITYRPIYQFVADVFFLRGVTTSYNLFLVF